MGMDDIVKAIGNDRLTATEIQTKLKDQYRPKTITRNLHDAYCSGRIDREKGDMKLGGPAFIYFYRKQGNKM